VRGGRKNLQWWSEEVEFVAADVPHQTELIEKN
jgi:hypothetical protein